MNCAIPVCCPANSPPPPPPTIVFLPTPAIQSSCCTHRCMLSLSDCPACTATRANGSSAPCLSWLLVTIRRRVSTVANPATIPRIRALAVTVYLQPGRRGSRWLLLLSVIYNLYHAAIHFGEGEFIIFPALPHTALYLTSSLPVITSCPVIIRSMTPGLCGGAPVIRPLLHSITGRQVRRILLL